MLKDHNSHSVPNPLNNPTFTKNMKDSQLDASNENINVLLRQTQQKQQHFSHQINNLQEHSRIQLQLPQPSAISNIQLNDVLKQSEDKRRVIRSPFTIKREIGYDYNISSRLEQIMQNNDSPLNRSRNNNLKNNVGTLQVNSKSNPKTDIDIQNIFSSYIQDLSDYKQKYAEYQVRSISPLGKTQLGNENHFQHAQVQTIAQRRMQIPTNHRTTRNNRITLISKNNHGIHSSFSPLKQRRGREERESNQKDTTQNELSRIGGDERKMNLREDQLHYNITEGNGADLVLFQNGKDSPLRNKPSNEMIGNTSRPDDQIYRASNDQLIESFGLKRSRINYLSSSSSQLENSIQSKQRRDLLCTNFSREKNDICRSIDLREDICEGNKQSFANARGDVRQQKKNNSTATFQMSGSTPQSQSLSTDENLKSPYLNRQFRQNQSCSYENVKSNSQNMRNSEDQQLKNWKEVQDILNIDEKILILKSELHFRNLKRQNQTGKEDHNSSPNEQALQSNEQPLECNLKPNKEALQCNSSNSKEVQQFNSSTKDQANSKDQAQYCNSITKQQVIYCNSSTKDQVHSKEQAQYCNSITKEQALYCTKNLLHSKEQVLWCNSSTKEQPLQINSSTKDHSKEQDLQINSSTKDHSKEQAFQINSSTKDHSKEQALYINSSTKDHSKEQAQQINSSTKDHSKEQSQQINSSTKDHSKEQAQYINSSTKDHSKEQSQQINSSTKDQSKEQALQINSSTKDKVHSKEQAHFNDQNRSKDQAHFNDQARSKDPAHSKDQAHFNDQTRSKDPAHPKDQAHFNDQASFKDPTHSKEQALQCNSIIREEYFECNSSVREQSLQQNLLVNSLQKENDVLNQQMYMIIKEKDEFKLVIEDLKRQLLEQNQLHESLICEINDLKQETEEKNSHLVNVLSQNKQILQDNINITDQFKSLQEQIESKSSQLAQNEIQYISQIQQIQQIIRQVLINSLLNTPFSVPFQFVKECIEQIMEDVENLKRPLIMENNALKEELVIEKERNKLISEGKMRLNESSISSSKCKSRDVCAVSLEEQVRSENQELKRSCEIWKSKYQKVRGQMKEVQKQFSEYSKVMVAMNQFQQKLNEQSQNMSASSSQASLNNQSSTLELNLPPKQVIPLPIKQNGKKDSSDYFKNKMILNPIENDKRQVNDVFNELSINERSQNSQAKIDQSHSNSLIHDISNGQSKENSLYDMQTPEKIKEIRIQKHDNFLKREDTSNQNMMDMYDQFEDELREEIMDDINRIEKERPKQSTGRTENEIVSKRLNSEGKPPKYKVMNWNELMGNQKIIANSIELGVKEIRSSNSLDINHDDDINNEHFNEFNVKDQEEKRQRQEEFSFKSPLNEDECDEIDMKISCEYQILEKLKDLDEQVDNFQLQFDKNNTTSSVKSTYLMQTNLSPNCFAQDEHSTSIPINSNVDKQNSMQNPLPDKKVIDNSQISIAQKPSHYQSLENQYHKVMQLILACKMNNTTFNQNLSK